MDDELEQGDPIAEEFANSDIGREGGFGYQPNPRQWDEFIEGSIVPAGEIQMEPDFIGQPAGQPQIVGQGVSGGGSQSVSRSGYAGGPRAVEDDFAREERRANETFAGMVPGFTQQAERAQQVAGDMRSGVEEEYKLTAQLHEQQAKLLDQLDDFYETSNLVAQKIVADGKVVREQHLNAYREQLSAVRALAMQDANPLNNITDAEQIGLVGARFAQGFLKAGYGIDIDVAGQIDREVQRGLMEHQQKIANAKDIAQDQFHLYQIAKESSEDDYESYMRYRGMVIESAKVKMEAEAMRFNSPLAMARFKQRSAQLDSELDATMAAIGDRKFRAYTELHKQGLERAKEMGRLKLEKQAQAISWHRAVTERKREDREAAKQKQEASAAAVKIQDPSNVLRDKKGNPISGGKIIAAIDPLLPKPLYDQVYKRVADAQQLYGEMHENLKDLEELKQKLDASGPEWFKKATSEEYRQWKAQRDLTVAAVRKFMSGTASSDKEGQMFLDTLEGDQWLQAGDNDALIPQMDKWGRKHFNNALKIPGVVAYDKEEYAPNLVVNPTAAAQERIDDSSAKPGTKITVAMMGEHSSGPRPKPQDAETFQEATKPSDLVPASPTWKKLMSEGVKLRDSLHQDTKEARRRDDGLAYDLDVQPKSTRYIEDLALAVLDPQAVMDRYSDRDDVNVPDDPEAVRNDAIAALSKLAADEGGYDEHLYAREMIKVIQRDPNEARRLLRSGW